MCAAAGGGAGAPAGSVAITVLAPVAPRLYSSSLIGRNGSREKIASMGTPKSR